MIEKKSQKFKFSMFLIFYINLKSKTKILNLSSALKQIFYMFLENFLLVGSVYNEFYNFF